MSIRPLDEQKCPLDIHMSIRPMDEQKCPFDIQMSIRPLGKQKCPVDIQMSIRPMDEQKCPVDIQMSIGHLAEVLDMYAGKSSNKNVNLREKYKGTKFPNESNLVARSQILMFRF